MPLILFSGKELQARSPYCWILEAICSPERSLKPPRKVSRKDSEFENLLRTAVRLFKAQKRAVGSKTAGSKENRKVRQLFRGI
jgi:hypothetical protein